MSKAFFEAERVSFSYYGKPLCLSDINFSMQKFDKVLLLASKEMGKTTFLKVLSTFEEPYFGNIFLNETNLRELDDQNKKFSLLFSTPVLLKNKTVIENLKLNSVEDGVDFDQLLKKYNLLDFQDNKVKKLSLFQQRLVALARSELKNPNILFLDDQFENLNTEESSKMQSILENLIADDQKTIIFAAGDESYKRCYELFCNANFAKVLYLVNSKLFEFGSLHEFEHDPVNLNQKLFFDEYYAEFQAILIRRENDFFIWFEDQEIQLPQEFNGAFLKLNLKNNDDEDIVLLFNNNFNLSENFNENLLDQFKHNNAMMFSGIDGNRLL